MSVTVDEVKYKQIIEEMASTCHGSESLAKFREFLKGLSGTKTRLAFLLPRLFQEAKAWLDVKDHVWSTVEKQDENNYVFVQGDIIETTKVLAVGETRSAMQHQYWLVLSPDCDCVRAEYISVAPIFPKDIEDGDAKVGLAAKLSGNKYFPISNFLSEDSTIFEPAYIAELSTPYYLLKRDKAYATVLKTCTVDGWHILNSLIQEKHTRAVDPGEGIKIRQ